MKLGRDSDIDYENWQYRMEDATKSYVLIDLDSAKAQPLVKSILNDLNLFPELRMLKVIQAMIGIVSILMTVLFMVALYRFPSKEILEESFKKLETKYNSPQDAKSKIEQIINSRNPVKSQT